MSSSPIISRSPSPLAEFDYLDMSHILASDAPIMTPTFDNDSQLPGSYPYSLSSPSTTTMDFVSSAQYNGDSSNYYVQPQPSPTDNMMKMRMDSGYAVPEGACMPTHQVFELDGPAPAPAQSRPQQQQQQQRVETPVPEPAAITSHKRSASRSLSPAAEFEMMLAETSSGASPLAPGQKKQRGAVISTKDFIPPDVSGMSKREARLVKNRAAAFLSRQRKREEFECMEIRVAELEKENARLLAIAQGQQPPAAAAATPQDEVEILRAQLAAAHEMIASSTQLHTMPPSPAISTRSLASPARSQQTSFTVPAPSSPRMKMEEPESDVVSIPSRGNTKSAAAGLGLMVLLCALPSLLSSMPQATSSAPATIDMPMSPSWAFSSLPDELPAFEWSSDMSSFSGMSSNMKTLEVEGMDVSFDTVPAEDGKIRVRIHNPSSQLLSSASPSSLSSSPSISFSAPNPKASVSVGSDFASLAPGDPFLGIGHGQMDAFDYTLDAPSYSRMGSPFGSDYGSEAGSMGSATATAAGKRRVRIALRSMPETGGKEGGEWEVEFC